MISSPNKEGNMERIWFVTIGVLAFLFDAAVGMLVLLLAYTA